MNPLNCDLHPPLNLHQAKMEAARCYFCYDAPCITACPTGINIPSFIRKISTENIKGAATDILSENIFGGTCARVCPVEALCEKACVRNLAEEKPVTIGQLQRFATDSLMAKKVHPFTRAKPTGKKVAVVGAGPAGLSCAHRLALYGHEVEVFESQAKAGGLNEYGLAPYKMVDDFAQKEIDFILKVCGIQIRTGKALGKHFGLKDLRAKFDAVFLGLGLQGVNALGLKNENWAGVMNAIQWIAQMRQAKNLNKIPVGKNVVVIGGGSTAIDVAVESKKLGAEVVTIVYRRGVDDMKSTWVEREIAQTHNVNLRTWAMPKKLIGNAKGVQAIEFERTKVSPKKSLVGTGETFQLQADQVFKAIGQILVPESLGDVADILEIKNGRILVDENRETSVEGVYAGGDCINGGALTVTSVQDGKLAAEAIHARLAATKRKVG